MSKWHERGIDSFNWWHEKLKKGIAFEQHERGADFLIGLQRRHRILFQYLINRVLFLDLYNKIINLYFFYFDLILCIFICCLFRLSIFKIDGKITKLFFPFFLGHLSNFKKRSTSNSQTYFVKYPLKSF